MCTFFSEERIFFHTELKTFILCKICNIKLGHDNNAIKKFLFLNSSADKADRNNDDSSTVRISLPFKDQVAANAVRKQLRDLSHKIQGRNQVYFFIADPNF